MKTSFFELSPEQQRLFNQLAAEGGFSTVENRRIPRRNAVTAPLSCEQQRLWFLNRFGVNSSVYNIPLATLIQGRLEIEALERAFSEITRRHEVFRTSLIEINGSVLQRVNQAAKFHLPVVTLQEQHPELRNAELRRLIAQYAQEPFDLKSDLLLRAALFRVDAEEHVLAINIHHIASDGWSLSILVKELSELYGAFSSGLPSPLQELAIQYADYSIWQREYLAGDALARHLSYWTEQLKGVEALELPFDRPRPAQMSYRGRNIPFALEPEVTAKLRDLCHAEGATLFMCLLAMWQIVLHRYSGQHDICVGSPVAGRMREDLEELIGFFVNTLVLRLKLEDDLSFQQLLQKTRQVCLEAFEHQDVPFEKVVTELQPERDMARTPLFQVMFALQNTAGDDLSLPGLKLTRFEPETLGPETAKFDLSMAVSEAAAELKCEVEYSTDLFDATTITSIIDSFKTLAQQVVESPGRKISEFVLSNENTPAMWRGPEPDHQGATAVESVAERALRSPDSVAIACEGIEQTYGELNRRAAKVASHLRALGAGLYKRVAVCLENPLDAITAMVGVLKAGSAVVPLEHSDPTPQLEYKLRNSGATWLITAVRLSKPLNGDSVKIIDLAEILSQPEVQDQEEALPVESNSLAAVMFRSGPTGSPQAVLVNHCALRQASFASHLDFMPSDRIALFLGSSAESWLEAFRALAAGSCVVPITAVRELSPRRVGSILRDRCVTTVFIHAGLLERLGKEFPWAFSNARLIVCNDNLEVLPELAEKLPPELLHKTYGCYGSCETGGRILMWRLSALKSQRLAIKPEYLLAGAQIYVLDGHLRPVAAGVVGELFAAGERISPGYDRKVTSASFLSADVLQERLYRTGEWVRYRTDGSLEFLGRTDGHMVIQGVPIDPGEIEAAFNLHPAVRSSAVAFRVSSGNRGGMLIALFSGVDNHRPATEDLASFLQEHLPAVMVPRKFIPVDDIPRTQRGEVDRKAVARMIVELESYSSTPSPYVAPRNETEEYLTQLWGKILEVEQIGVHDNFFRLGGHSLLATQLVANINDKFQIDLPLRHLFESPSIAELAPMITSMQAAPSGAASDGASIPVITRTRREKYCAAVVPD